MKHGQLVQKEGKHHDIIIIVWGYGGMDWTIGLDVSFVSIGLSCERSMGEGHILTILAALYEQKELKCMLKSNQRIGVAMLRVLDTDQDRLDYWTGLRTAWIALLGGLLVYMQQLPLVPLKQGGRK